MLAGNETTTAAHKEFQRNAKGCDAEQNPKTDCWKQTENIALNQILSELEPELQNFSKDRIWVHVYGGDRQQQHYDASNRRSNRGSRHNNRYRS